MPDDVPEKNTQDVIGKFIDFLKAFSQAPDEERRNFLDFITPQSRADLLSLADALRKEKTS
jgi:hypothetical protein